MPFEMSGIAWLSLQSQPTFIYCDFPALILLIASGYRLPNAVKGMRWIWIHGKSVLATSYLLSVGCFIYFNGHLLTTANTDGLLFSVVIIMTDLTILVWLLSSSLVNDIFEEFPETIKKNEQVKVIKSLTTDRLLALELQRNNQRDLIETLVYKNPPSETFFISEDAAPEMPLEIAAKFESNNQLCEAEWVYRSLLRRWPDFADAWHALGLLAYQAGKREHGIALVTEAMRLDGKTGLYRRNIGEMYRRMGQEEQAIHYGKLACKLSPEDADAWHYYGIALTNAKRFREAIEAFHKVIALKPRHIHCWNNLGVALQAKGNLAEAGKAYQKALIIDPTYKEAQKNMRKLLQYEDKPL